MQLRSWMIPAEACQGTFVALKGACGKTTTTTQHLTLELEVIGSIPGQGTFFCKDKYAKSLSQIPEIHCTKKQSPESRTLTLDFPICRILYKKESL